MRVLSRVLSRIFCVLSRIFCVLSRSFRASAGANFKRSRANSRASNLENRVINSSRPEAAARKVHQCPEHRPCLVGVWCAFAEDYGKNDGTPEPKNSRTSGKQTLKCTNGFMMYQFSYIPPLCAYDSRLHSSRSFALRTREPVEMKRSHCEPRGSGIKVAV